MDKRELKEALFKKTKCELQHTGWPCGTCFFSINKKLNNQDWQALLYYRGDNKKEDLNNLPQDIEKSIENIYKLVQK